MARQRQRRIYWEPPQDTDIEAYEIYVSGSDDSAFLSNIENGEWEPFASVLGDVDSWYIAGDFNGVYQFAVCARDIAGNYSDPYQHNLWAVVNLDSTPPNPPYGGGID